MIKKNNFIVCVLLVLLFVSCQKEEKPYIELKGRALGTSFTIKYKDEKQRSFIQNINFIFNKINHSLSTYSKNSDISRINRGEMGVEIDDDFKKVLAISRKLYRDTDGALDPTIGVLVNAWGFGPGKKVEELSSFKIDSMMQYVGLNKIRLIDGNIILKESREVYMDFNASAKGYTIDIIALMLEDQKITDYMIEIGGELKVKGYSGKGKLWSIAIENPNTDGRRDYTRIVELNNESMATSGNYRKFSIDDKGNKYVHILDSKTGLAKESNLLSVTVIGNIDCIYVDGYATALMSMGLEKAIKFSEKRKDLKILLLYYGENKEIKEYKSSDFIKNI
ncbi:MAG: FAD:protein FMN transferase [Flavobacteriaceae bacterium]|nr:FAD:protein FMN transferase [Flavobacteriaceae bacterium]